MYVSGALSVSVTSAPWLMPVPISSGRACQHVSREPKRFEHGRQRVLPVASVHQVSSSDSGGLVYTVEVGGDRSVCTVEGGGGESVRMFT